MSDAKSVTKLTPAEPVGDVVADLEAMLEEARHGDLVGIAYVAIYKGRNVVRSWAMPEKGAPMFPEMIGQLSLLAHRMAHRQLDHNEQLDI